MLDHFGNEFFSKYKALDIDQFIINSTFETDGKAVLKNSNVVYKHDELYDANIFYSHIICNAKMIVDFLLKIKARIASYRNIEDLHIDLSKSCKICPPVGLRVSKPYYFNGVDNKQGEFQNYAFSNSRHDERCLQEVTFVKEYKTFIYGCF